MLKVKLETSNGGHVGHATIPPFNKLPDVLVWGQRFFKLHDAKSEAVIYRECFTCFVVSEVTD